MSLSADALNFVLALDDRLTPALGRAGKSYARFTRDLDKQNSRAVKSVNKAFSAMSDLARSFEALPKKAVESYRAAAQAVQRITRPVRMKVVLDVAGRKFEQGLARAVTAAVRRALASATMNVQLGANGRAVGRSARGGPATAAPPLPAAVMAPAAAPPRVQRDLFVPNNPRDALGTAGRLSKRAYQDVYAAAGKAVGGKNAGTSLQALQLAFLGMPAYERRKAMADYLAMTKALRTGGAPPNTPAAATGRGGGGNREPRRISGIANDTRFLAIMSAFDHLTPFLNKAAQFNQGMNTINKGVHLSRADLGQLRDMGTTLAGQTGGVLNTTDAQAAMLALKQVGVTTRDEWAKLTPVVALSAKAMTITVDEAAGAARVLSKQMGLSKDAIEDTMAELAKIEEQTGFSGGAAAAAMQSNAQAAAPFLNAPGMMPKARQGALTNLAKLEGALLQGGVAPDDARAFVGQVASALGGNQEAAKAVTQATGLGAGPGGALEAAARSGNWTAAIQQMALNANRAGNAQQLTATAGAWGVSPSGVSAIGAHGADVLSALAAENAGQVGAGGGNAALVEFSKTAMAAGEQTANKAKDMIMSWIPDIVKNTWAETAGGAMAATIATTVAQWVFGAAAKAVGLGGAAKVAAAGAEAAAGGLGGAAAGRLGAGAGAAARLIAGRAIPAVGAALAGFALGDAIGDRLVDALENSTATDPDSAFAKIATPVGSFINSMSETPTATTNWSMFNPVQGLAPHVVTDAEMDTAAKARMESTAANGAGGAAAIQSLQDALTGALGSMAPNLTAPRANGPAPVAPRDTISDSYLRYTVAGGY